MADPAASEASHARLQVLLDVQQHDTHLDQLEHRRRTMPERAALRAVGDELAAAEARREGVTGEFEKAAAEQERLEREVSATESRIAEVDKRLYSAAGAASRDLTAMADEVTSLKRRLSGLEDQVLEAMEVVDPLVATLDEIDARRAALDAQAAALHAAIAEAEVSIDAEAAEEQRTRATLASALPEALLERYEALRRKLGGVGAAPLVGSSCGGCHLTLPSVELEKVRHAAPDAVVTCDQCGRILIHS